MENLDVNKGTTVKLTPSHFGGDDEDDIPDMADFEESDNVIETDPVSVKCKELLIENFYYDLRDCKCSICDAFQHTHAMLFKYL